MAVGHHNGVDRLGADRFQQARDDGIARIDEKQKSSLLQKVAAARRAGFRPPAAAP
jgi:hypothetical protein